MWLLAAAAFAFIGIVIKASLPTPPVLLPPPPLPDDPKKAAALIREDAQNVCGDEHWYLCRRMLDEAAAADPAGEGEPRVVKMREGIAAWEAASARDAH